MAPLRWNIRKVGQAYDERIADAEVHHFDTNLLILSSRLPWAGGTVGSGHDSLQRNER